MKICMLREMRKKLKVFIVYCHPSNSSFTFLVKEEFMKGLEAAGHEYVVSDLYQMNFDQEISEEEYQRETYYRYDVPLKQDVLEEQRKIQQADAIVFIYPVFWTEAPAKLVGWFDRVWTSGFAYNPDAQMKILKKALIIAVAGKSIKSLIDTGEERAMRTVMLGDRIRNRSLEKDMVILDCITHDNEELRERKMNEHLKRVYFLGFNF